VASSTPAEARARHERALAVATAIASPLEEARALEGIGGEVGAAYMWPRPWVHDHDHGPTGERSESPVALPAESLGQAVKLTATEAT
jgi:hypothetical protein